MLSLVLSAVVLVAITMWIHPAGISALLSPACVHEVAPSVTNPRPGSHGDPAAHDLVVGPGSYCGDFRLDISYLFQGCLPNAEAAFYFSGTTYTTVGYGDVVLAKPWRLLGPLEGLISVLMCGLSTGYFFVIVSRLYQSLNITTSEN